MPLFIIHNANTTNTFIIPPVSISINNITFLLISHEIGNSPLDNFHKGIKFYIIMHDFVRIMKTDYDSCKFFCGY